MVVVLEGEEGGRERGRKEGSKDKETRERVS